MKELWDKDSQCHTIYKENEGKSAKIHFPHGRSANSVLKIPVSIDYSAIKHVYILSCFQKAGGLILHIADYMKAGTPASSMCLHVLQPFITLCLFDLLSNYTS